MTRGTYKPSEETKRRLLEAAGELFAQHGVSSVSLREIADRAGVALNAICYHFGGKDGLVAAVWNCALDRWDDRRLEKYVADHEALFADRFGQRRLVVGAIATLYDQFCENLDPLWISVFLQRSFITAQCPERVARVFGVQMKDVFCGIYRRITGDANPYAAVCWALTIISPGSIVTASATDFTTFKAVESIDVALLRRLQETVTRNALASVGLGDEENHFTSNEKTTNEKQG